MYDCLKLKLITKSLTLALVASAMTCALEGRAVADDYPTRPVTVIAAVGAGSSGDLTLRIVGEKMTTILGQRLIIENVAGAAGLAGSERAARSDPDGYTLLGGGDTIVTTVPILYKEAKYNPLKDLDPIAQLAKLEWALVAAPSSNIKSVSDLIAAAKEKSGKLNYASGGNGSPQHIAMELFQQEADVKLTHVPYRSAAAALNDVVSGVVPVMFTGLSVALPFLQDGKLQLLGTGSTQRSPVTPQDPTIAESGVPGFTFSSYVAMLAPHGTEPDIIAKLNKAALEALADPVVAKRLKDAGVQPWGTSATSFKETLAADYAAREKLIRSVGLKAD